MKQAIKDMTKKLKLNKYPKVIIETEDKGYVMAASGKVWERKVDWFTTVVTRTESDYILKVNKNAVNRMIKRYTYQFGNKQAAYDCIYLLICHELRHMWQYQEGFEVGKRSTLSNFDELMGGHGSDPCEMDANKWMIAVAERRGFKELALFMELEQRSNGLCNMYDHEFIESLIVQQKVVLERYNKYLYKLRKLMK